jgi:hypothetical protein
MPNVQAHIKKNQYPINLYYSAMQQVFGMLKIARR